MSSLRMLSVALIGFGAFAAGASAADTTAASGVDAKQAIADAVSGDWRSDTDKSRDAARHPRASLEFWGLQPGMTILEVQPGGGYWTEILAPFAHRTGGKYYATAADLDNPETSEDRKSVV